MFVCLEGREVNLIGVNHRGDGKREKDLGGRVEGGSVGRALYMSGGIQIPTGEGGTANSKLY
jgi:hypothetical protein